MRKVILHFFVICFFVFSVFPDSKESISFTLDGNAHIFSYNDLRKVLSANCDTYSATNLYNSYQDLVDSCGNNKLLQEQKEETEFNNTVIRITGRVSKVRKSILDEYIVELTTSGSIINVGVVYPKRISQKMKNELMSYKQGDYFEAIAITRKTYCYCDIPVWNQNGVYRTEP